MKKIYTFIFACLFTTILFAQIPGSCGKNNPPQINNGNASLGQTYSNAACGLNYVQTSQLIEKRFDQYTTAGNYGSGLPTTLSVSGIPSLNNIDKAYIWYIVSYIGATP